jgi:hypothetical protein
MQTRSILWLQKANLRDHPKKISIQLPRPRTLKQAAEETTAPDSPCSKASKLDHSAERRLLASIWRARCPA